MKEKLTLYIDKDIKSQAKFWVKNSAFGSISAFVEYSLSKQTHTLPHQDFAQKWGGVLSSENKLRKAAIQDEKLQHYLDKHLKP